MGFRHLERAGGRKSVVKDRYMAYLKSTACNSSYRQLSISSPTRDLFQCHLNVWTHDWDITREGGDGREEISKEDENAVEFDEKPCQGPPQQYETYPCHECSCAFELLTSREEGEGLLDSDNEGEADQEEDLDPIESVQCRGVF